MEEAAVLACSSFAMALTLTHTADMGTAGEDVDVGELGVVGVVDVDVGAEASGLDAWGMMTPVEEVEHTPAFRDSEADG